MPSQFNTRLNLTAFARPVCALVAAATIGCTGTVSPPDSTPVYAEDVGQGVEPVDVEHQSTTRPDPEKVSTGEEKADAPAPEEAPAETTAATLKEQGPAPTTPAPTTPPLNPAPTP